ncbi:hypothetical protein HKX54_16725 [Sulfitobacter sp. M57]|uniref:hypothetical protein n=1 Tax=unclassified Sulfitobacter TaxID=196795 RepID=UPI0023E169BB|nr:MULTISPECIES: hypothetical protein [unclassified Sulfitobacter]MDF3416057.1 hypothetical protein [Sulfitobacter sp. KE5]MDF3423536.1 hypothetical protein [Sulfitobacter sp. KE43]MDF3434662.1 hypothetical protein [Sulfitobacter sp. KE42]MDF3460242.1 hypothetical protein [Sulfitobacter sp. S74]MDF3464200.1 hypothetical protein [Sulfitobacter sp. Ks18]
MWKQIALCVSLLAAPLAAQEKSFSLQLPQSLSETGFANHLLPRFSLKTGIRITRVPQDADVTIGHTGTPVFRGGGTLWHLSQTDAPYTNVFRDWLMSDIGKRTIEAFAPQGVPLFSAQVATTAESDPLALTGDTVLGETVSLERCGRCHVVNDSNRMKAIGSTPSFALLRSFDDWQERFETFFLRKPHPAFTQVADVTSAFAANRPPPIAPIEVTLNDIAAIVSFVALIDAADLGAPLQSQ